MALSLHGLMAAEPSEGSGGSHAAGLQTLERRRTGARVRPAHHPPAVRHAPAVAPPAPVRRRLARPRPPAGLLGFGRIVVSEIEVPNMLVNLA
jgi:hypothetical protein